MNRFFAFSTVLFLMLSVGCYSTQMMPPITLHVADDHGQRIDGVSGHWNGDSNEEDIWKRRFDFDPNGFARLPRYEIHGNVVSLLGSLCLSMFPRQGGPHDPYVSIQVFIPNRYEVDEAASGLSRKSVSGYNISWEDLDGAAAYFSSDYPPGDTRDGSWNTLSLELLRPAALGPKEYHFILRRKRGSGAAIGDH